MSGNAQCWDENMHFEHLSRLRQSGCKSGVRGWGWERGCKREKEGTPSTRAASFAFRPLFQLSQLSLQRPIRIRRTLFCMTDFTWECIAKGRFVAAEHEKIFATEYRRRESHRKPNVNVKKNSSFRFCGVNFSSGGGPALFENLFSPSGRVERCGAEFSSLLRVYWVAINQKRKLVRTR